MALVYALASSKEPDIIRYIGRTKSNSPDKRLISHKNHMRRGTKTHVYNWMRSVYRDNDYVIATLIEPNLSWEESGERERYWIKFYREQGADLTNISLGGDGSFSVSQETRDLMSKNRKGKSPSPQAHAAAKFANIGRIKTKEERIKISNANKGKKRTAEQCSAISKRAKERPRKPHTQETKEKIRIAKLGNSISAEARAKISAANKTRIVTAETRNKLSKASKGRKHSTETRKKISESNKRRTYSLETRKKISDSIKLSNLKKKQTKLDIEKKED